jgi:hypothetical protein
MTEGIREGFFDYYQGLYKRKCTFTIKKIFTVQRIAFLFLLTAISFYFIQELSILIAVGQIFMFRYFHKLLYEIVSKKLNTEIEEDKEESKVLRILNKYKKCLFFIGMSLQIIMYIYL